ncbi:MAG: Na(+)/H(+) antiporter subunit B [Thermodesulfovibrionales bacterium]
MIILLEDIIVKTLCRFLIPFIQLFGLYVIAHGHGSPGGGFQGGCILAASFVLILIAFDLAEAKKRFSEKLNNFFNSFGVLIYTGTGWLCLLLGGNYLDYGKLSKILSVDPVQARYYGVFAVEVGVGITVMAVMVSIFLDLITGGKHEEASE